MPCAQWLSHDSSLLPQQTAAQLQPPLLASSGGHDGKALAKTARKMPTASLSLRSYPDTHRPAEGALESINCPPPLKTRSKICLATPLDERQSTDPLSGHPVPGVGQGWSDCRDTYLTDAGRRLGAGN